MFSAGWPLVSHFNQANCPHIGACFSSFPTSPLYVCLSACISAHYSIVATLTASPPSGHLCQLTSHHCLPLPSALCLSQYGYNSIGANLLTLIARAALHLAHKSAYTNRSNPSLMFRALDHCSSVNNTLVAHYCGFVCVLC